MSVVDTFFKSLVLGGTASKLSSTKQLLHFFKQNTQVARVIRMSNQTNFAWNGANYCKFDYQNSCIVFVTDLKCVSHDLQKLKRPLTLFI